MLYLSSPVNLTTSIQPACLPEKTSNTYPGSGLYGFIAGWGTTFSGGSTPALLNNVKINVYDASTCKNVAKLTNGQICAGMNLFFC